MNSVLVIDSNRSARLGVRDLLTAALPELEVLTSENAKDALTLAHRKRPLLILLAARMMGVSSTQIARALRALPETRQIPVVVVASPAQTGGQGIAALCETCDAVLPLSNPSALLVATVERYLAQAGSAGQNAPHC